MARKTVADLVAEARQQVENLTPAEVAAELERGDAIVVDIREPEEIRQQGMIPGAIHAPRGMLEFYADPSTPYHRDDLDPERRTILYCAGGGRSALAARTLAELGYGNVAHLDGGFQAWTAEGRPIEPPA